MQGATSLKIVTPKSIEVEKSADHQKGELVKVTRKGKRRSVL